MVDSTPSAFTSVALVVLVGMSGAYAFVALGGHPGDRLVADPFRDPDTVLVTFPTHTIDVVTREYPIGPDGTLAIDAFPIPYTNITRLSVTMHANMTGLTVRDRFDVTIAAPNGDGRSGAVEGPASTNGYRSSELVVSEWPRVAAPKEEHHATADIHDALAWAAANHTDRRSTGDWRIDVQLTPPGTLAQPREGRLLFTFLLTRYEGEAHPGGVRDTDGSDPTAPPQPT